MSNNPKVMSIRMKNLLVKIREMKNSPVRRSYIQEYRNLLIRFQDIHVQPGQRKWSDIIDSVKEGV